MKAKKMKKLRYYTIEVNDPDIAVAMFCLLNRIFDEDDFWVDENEDWAFSFWATDKEFKTIFNKYSELQSDAWNYEYELLCESKK